MTNWARSPTGFLKEFFAAGDFAAKTRLRGPAALARELLFGAGARAKPKGKSNRPGGDSSSLALRAPGSGGGAIREPSGTGSFCGVRGAKCACPPLRGRFSDRRLEPPVELHDHFRIKFPVSRRCEQRNASTDGQHRAGAHLEMNASGQIQTIRAGEDGNDSIIGWSDNFAVSSCSAIR